MFPRALIGVAVINRSLLPHVLLPLGALTVVGTITAAILYRRMSRRTEVEADIQNPLQLRLAIFFGVLFAAVLLVSEYANEWLGASGIYATAFVSGIADVDAITLTLSKLAADGVVAPEVATTGIVIAAIMNTLMKAGLAWVMGTRQLGQRVTAVLLVVAVTGVILVVI